MKRPRGVSVSIVVDAQSAAKAFVNLMPNSKRCFRTHSHHELQRDEQEAALSRMISRRVMHSNWGMSQRRDEQTPMQSDARRNARISNGLFAKILVAVDGSKNAHRAAKIAVKLSVRNGAELLVISVVPRPSYLFAPVSGAGVPPMGLGDYYTYATNDAVKWVNETISLAKDRGVVARGRVLKSASVVRSITDYAEDEKVDLIVLGTRGMGGFNRLLLGSVSNGVVIHAHCAVLVVR